MRGRETSEREQRSAVPRPFRSFFTALQFLTRLPIPIQLHAAPHDIGLSVVWFPLVGLLIGALVLGASHLATTMLARPVGDALAIWALVAITGALHVDGLVDTADGLSAGTDPATRLEAMRQSTAGAPGALAGCAILVAGYAALSGLSDGVRPAALLLAPLCGRSAILLGYGVFPYPRPELGASRALKEGATPGRVVAGLLLAAAVAVAVAGPPGVLLLALTLALGLAIGRFVSTRVPGLTGDNHGAICELTQLAALVGAPVLLTR